MGKTRKGLSTRLSRTASTLLGSLTLSATSVGWRPTRECGQRFTTGESDHRSSLYRTVQVLRFSVVWILSEVFQAVASLLSYGLRASVSATCLPFFYITSSRHLDVHLSRLCSMIISTAPYACTATCWSTSQPTAPRRITTSCPSCCVCQASR